MEMENGKREIRTVVGLNVREVVAEANRIGVEEVIGVYQVEGSVVMLYWHGED